MSVKVVGRAARSASGERGVTIPLVALCIVALMVFCAFAIDVGAAYSQRRANQGSVDTAATSAGVRFLLTGSFDTAVMEAKTRITANMGARPSQADWDACTDPDALSISSMSLGLPSGHGSPCISFAPKGDRGMYQMRIRLPDIQSPTAFATVIGVKSLQTHAVAVVDIGSPLGGAFPAFVYTGVQPGDVVCILNAPGGQNTPCSGSSSGQFGTFQPYYYAPGAGCASGNQGSGNYFSQAPAIAKGLDHLLSPYTTFPSDSSLAGQRVNGDLTCTVMAPNTVNNSTGFSNQTITQGLVTGSSSQGSCCPAYGGRLRGGPYADGLNGTLNTAPMARLGNIDNAPLWYYLKSASDMSASTPLECKVAAQMPYKRDVAATSALEVAQGLTQGGGVAMYSSPELVMAACLGKWKLNNGPIFKDSVGTTMRLGAVPRYWETTAGSASSNYHIRDFVPIFLTGEFQSGGSGDVANDPTVTHWAGAAIPTSGNLYQAWNPGNAKSLLQGEAAMFVPCKALPTSVCNTVYDDPSDNGLGGTLFGVTLSK